MKIEILGCSGSVMPGYNTTSILLNGDTLIDAGSAASVLDEFAISAIRNILITHSHLDHIKELPFILDTLYSQNGSCVTIWGSSETVSSLHEHIFNGIIWPEIRELNCQREFVKILEVPRKEFILGSIQVETMLVDHISGSLSYLFTDGKVKVIFSGDTGYDNRLFDIVHMLNTDLKALFVEVSFPNRLEEFAVLTRHLTPNLLEMGLGDMISSPLKVFAYHMKPKYIDEVVAELPANVAYISGGEVFDFE